MTAWRELRLFAGDAVLVAAKDLRIEWRARTTLGQVLPFALLVLVLFGFALDANRPTLRLATPGLLWMTVLFATVVAVQRSAAVESADGARRVLLLSGMAPAAAFAGKAAAVAVQLLDRGGPAGSGRCAAVRRGGRVGAAGRRYLRSRDGGPGRRR